MENKKAIAIIKDELKHCQIHLEDKNKAPEYYQEMNELCEAYEMAIKALENQESQIDLDEYKSRLVSKYSDGDEATDFDKGITMALDLLEEMEDERS